MWLAKLPLILTFSVLVSKWKFTLAQPVSPGDHSNGDCHNRCGPSNTGDHTPDRHGIGLHLNPILEDPHLIPVVHRSTIRIARALHEVGSIEDPTILTMNSWLQPHVGVTGIRHQLDFPIRSIQFGVIGMATLYYLTDQDVVWYRTSPPHFIRRYHLSVTMLPEQFLHEHLRLTHREVRDFALSAQVWSHDMHTGTSRLVTPESARSGRHRNYASWVYEPGHAGTAGFVSTEATYLSTDSLTVRGHFDIQIRWRLDYVDLYHP